MSNFGLLFVIINGFNFGRHVIGFLNSGLTVMSSSPLKYLFNLRLFSHFDQFQPPRQDEFKINFLGDALFKLAFSHSQKINLFQLLHKMDP